MVAVYVAQNVEDKHDPTHYIDLYDSQELVNVSRGSNFEASNHITI
jgi:hypothetical protein